jgi:hypothetical protein
VRKVPASRKAEIKQFNQERNLDELCELLRLVFERTKHIYGDPSEFDEYDRILRRVVRLSDEQRDTLIEFLYNLTDEELIYANECLLKIDAMQLVFPG